ncbi:hypothetical protein MKOR_12480 [Mycolicibacillus koreensis]|uniref:Uncharacterized protein n=1 Tax=Mycolicibacillus koreensis TaxID=1069220 RepID=A0A7I7SAT1_9MYCO|nr:hypothetical protein B8W67_13715 [Mycolicibacillus koreensis]BBY53997.1 hypothetical protein MKOR_12480 [Mycolicibacillus koreensis]
MKGATWRVRNLSDESVYVVADSMPDALARAAALGLGGGERTWVVGVTSPVAEHRRDRVLPPGA